MGFFCLGILLLVGQSVSSETTANTSTHIDVTLSLSTTTSNVTYDFLSATTPTKVADDASTTVMHPPPASSPAPDIIPVPESASKDPEAGGNTTHAADATSDSVPPKPVWSQCLSQATIDTPVNNTLPSQLKHWCSNYNTVIPCLERGLNATSEDVVPTNDLDGFISLHFNAEQLRVRSMQICPAFQEISDKLQCIQERNRTLVDFCQRRFSLALQYVYEQQIQKSAKIDIFKYFACRVTMDLTMCLNAAMPTCSFDIKRKITAYYSLLTNETCLADPEATPAPQAALPPDVVVTCSKNVSETLPQTEELPFNASEVDLLIYGLKENCRTFELRYSCYDEELNKITNHRFRDLWLIFTFDRENAVKAQREFCEAFEGGIVEPLNAQCYNDTKPRLRDCEVYYGNGVLALQKQWSEGRIQDGKLYLEACRISLTRAFCIRNAFQLCGEALGQAMLASEIGTLPDMCLTLLQNNDTGNISDERNAKTGQSVGSGGLAIGFGTVAWSVLIALSFFSRWAVRA